MENMVEVFLGKLGMVLVICWLNQVESASLVLVLCIKNQKKIAKFFQV